MHINFYTDKYIIEISDDPYGNPRSIFWSRAILWAKKNSYLLHREKCEAYNPEIDSVDWEWHREGKRPAYRNTKGYRDYYEHGAYLYTCQCLMKNQECIRHK